MNIGIVMARSTSTRTPNKNIRRAAGQPLFAHALNTLAQSNTCDRIILATDSEHYASIAKDYPFDDTVLRDPSWDFHPHNMEFALEQSLNLYEQKNNLRAELCAFIGANCLFVRPSWFTAAELIIRRYHYHYFPVHLVTSDLPTIPMGVFRAHTTRVHSKTFVLKNRSIICDIDYPEELEAAQDIATLLAQGKIRYTDRDFHLHKLNDDLHNQELTPNNEHEDSYVSAGECTEP